MSTSVNQYDAIERLIFEEGLRINALDFHPELDLMIIVLNTKAVFHHKLSPYKLLKKADKSQLMNYQLIGEGTGIHWPNLDEDLSLKGILQDVLRKAVKPDNDALAA